MHTGKNDRAGTEREALGISLFASQGLEMGHDDSSGVAFRNGKGVF
jgi:hypothetical protein